MLRKIPPGAVTMSDWNIVIVEYQGRVVEKFLGYCYELSNYRFSTEILEYDAESNTGMTRSGSTYVFLERPGKLHPVAEFYLKEFSKCEGIRVRLKYEY